MKAGYLPSAHRANVPLYALSTAIMLHLVIVLVLYKEYV